MAKYLLIESRDPFDANDVANFCDLAEGLVRKGSEVTLFLVQNGVLQARQGSRSPGVANCATVAGNRGEPSGGSRLKTRGSPARIDGDHLGLKSYNTGKRENAGGQYGAENQ